MIREWLAMAFLTGVFAFPLITLWKKLRRPPYSPPQWLLYYLDLFLVRFLWRAQLPRRLPLPAGQGAVIICNHRSSVDPCFIQAVARRRLVHWMIAQVFSPHTLVGRLLSLSGMIPVWQEGANRSPARAALRLAKRGELVGILPEGRINTSSQFMLSVRPGAVVVALRARVPIVPCYIEGAPYHPSLWKSAFMPARVRLSIGKPIDLSPYYGRQREAGLAERLMCQCVQEIARLAGNHDFQPTIEVTVRPKEVDAVCDAGDAGDASREKHAVTV